MGRTWKDKNDLSDFLISNDESKKEFLDYFYNQHDFILNRLIENNVIVNILDQGQRISLKYYNWEQNYYPLTGEHTLRLSDTQSKLERQTIIIPRVSNKSGTPYQGKKKIKKIPVIVKKNHSKYNNFIDFIEKFISKTNIPPQTYEYYKDKTINDSQKQKEIHPIIIDINQEIIDYLKKHPDFIYNISSRKFEELIAHIMKNFGFDVELTKATRDGGRDILAYIRNAVCSYLTFIECKHFSLSNPVGVGIVREVYGVQHIYRPNKSLIVTSSYFTKDAIDLVKLNSSELELKDHTDIKKWLNDISLK